MRRHYVDAEIRDVPRLMDQRETGESFCSDCPDHEACATGIPCYTVRLIDYLHDGGVV